MIIYHGSKNIISQPCFGIGNPKNDYGLGFYCTENLELAKDYWENKVNDKKRINEVLVDGTIKVIEIIKEYN